VSVVLVLVHATIVGGIVWRISQAVEWLLNGRRS
jgi:hypothetical protein